jgi:hypothetical protein
VTVTANPVAFEPLQSWQRDGWSGINVQPGVSAAVLERNCASDASRSSTRGHNVR